MSANITHPAQGSCFGLEVRSALPFRYVRPGAGVPLTVDETRGETPDRDGDLVIEWPPEGNGGASRLYRDGARSHFWIDGPGWFDIAPTVPSITLPPLPYDELRQRRAPGVTDDELLAWREVPMWGIPAMLCFIEQGFVPLHAASIDVGGAGLLIGGPGTFGKTTLSAAFHAAGHRLLSDDISSCALLDPPAVLPGPALVRLRRDVFERMRLRDATIAFANASRVTLAIAPARRGDSRPIPLRAIVLLQRPTASIVMTRADPAQAVRDLLALCFTGVLDRARAFADVASLVATVPVWYLARPLEYDELPRVVERIVSEAVGGTS